jgi:cytochrome c551/c552
MEVGPDGKLYLLEYGTGWFSKNADAGLARIDYNSGNISPKIAGATIDKTSGKLPFTIKAKVDARDPDNGKLTYVWNLGTTTKETTTPELEYTFTTPGDVKVSVEVKDNDGGSSKINIAEIYAGNEEPVVSIQLTGGNRSFFLPGRPFTYQVNAKDNDTAAIDPANFFVSVDYKEPGFDNAANTEGHQEGGAIVSGKNLMLSLDCKSCHKEIETSVGPAYIKVAEKYRNDAAAVNALPQKIINGTKGIWGEAAMPAHPALPADDAQSIVTWIMSLGKTETVQKSLPPSGSYTPTGEQKPGNVLVLTASYTDKGGNNIKSLTGTGNIVLPSNYRPFSGTEEVKGFIMGRQTGNAILRFPDTTGYFGVDSLDLTGVRSVKVITRWRNPPETGFGFEVRLDALNGKLLGKGSIPKPAKDQRTGDVPVTLAATEDNKLHKLYFIFKAPDPSKPVRAGVATLQFN